MRIIWSPTSFQKLAEIIDYVSSYDADTAANLVRKFETQIRSLKKASPIHANDSSIKWVRELVIHPHYLVIYEIRDDQIWVLTVRRTRQEYDE